MENLQETNLGGSGNIIYKGQGFEISYNPRVVPSIFDFLMPSGGAEETALIVDDNYYILNGDFRHEYDQCKTLKQALGVFKKNKKFKSCWSN